MTNDGFFTILDSVDSTNNYAIGQVHAGLAKSGMCWFTHDQTGGKGQRGKTWAMEKGKNIAMSVVFEPGRAHITNPFHLNAAVALTCFEFFKCYAGDETKIKWPNDLFWRDRKAGGILIENIFQGTSWKWTVVGIGININQTRFETFLINPVSLKQITGKQFDQVELALELYELLLKNLANLEPMERLLPKYNQRLYGLHKTVTLKKDAVKFETLVKEVTPQGRLVTVDSMEREFDFGEVEWVL
ncbi:MAG: biotin--[acetyl-CoA-carboxylase] ligase [Chitinophagaceae bacterium]|nr:biotin--[acetyl-CoA-carboxylase] ligase [Chitinophagaceae bacterium]